MQVLKDLTNNTLAVRQGCRCVLAHIFLVVLFSLTSGCDGINNESSEGNLVLETELKIKQKEYEKALQTVDDQLVSCNPNAYFLLARGYLLIRQHKLIEAHLHYKALEDLIKTNPEIANELVKVYRTQGKYLSAIEILDEDVDFGADSNQLSINTDHNRME